MKPSSAIAAPVMRISTRYPHSGRGRVRGRESVAPQDGQDRAEDSGPERPPGWVGAILRVGRDLPGWVGSPVGSVCYGCRAWEGKRSLMQPPPIALLYESS